MFPIVAISLTIALGLGASAVEFPAFQEILFIGSALAAMAFCCALEVWSSEASSEPAAPAPEPHEPLTDDDVRERFKEAA